MRQTVKDEGDGGANSVIDLMRFVCGAWVEGDEGLEKRAERGG